MCDMVVAMPSRSRVWPTGKAPAPANTRHHIISAYYFRAINDDSTSHLILKMHHNENRVFYPNLESLRGLAALMVAFAHSYSAISFSGVDKLWDLSVWQVGELDALFAKFILIFCNGAAAVTIFFVLSGVVLGLSLDASMQPFPQRYVEFLIKRIFRIYPSHLFVLFGICMLLFFSGWVNPGTFERATTWYNWFYLSLPDIRSVLNNALLLQVLLNPVTWTLAVEVAVALIFPLLHTSSRHPFRPAVLQSFILICLIVLPKLLPQHYILLPHIYKFYAGLLIPIYGTTIAMWITERFAFLRFSTHTLLTIALTALLIEPALVQNEAFDSISRTVGAVILIHILSLRTSGGLLHLHIFKKLGQYSYSFYLIHFPLLWFGYYIIHSVSVGEELIRNFALPVASVMALISVVVAYFLASISYWLIEKPSLLLGRNLARKFRKD